MPDPAACGGGTTRNEDIRAQKPFLLAQAVSGPARHPQRPFGRTRQRLLRGRAPLLPIFPRCDGSHGRVDLPPVEREIPREPYQSSTETHLREPERDPVSPSG